MAFWKLAGGTVYDPTNGVRGAVADIWIDGGKIVAPPTYPSRRPDRTLDVSGMVVMPGGVDMHCHIAGPKVNLARRMRSEEKRQAEPVRRTRTLHSGTMGSVPSSFATGYKYAALGYTTAMDAAIPPLLARHAHEEFADTPCIDKGFYVLLGNNHYVMRAIQRQEPERATAFIAWLLGAAKSYAAKLVNPGGVEEWKASIMGNVHALDDVVDAYGVTPRQIIQTVAGAVDELRLPHAVHIHANNLGLPGNWTTTLDTLRALDGRRGHLTHIQFHSYGGSDGDEATFSSQVQSLVDYVNSHANVTVDVGQVLFGETTSMTGDGPLGYYLSRLYRSRWVSADTEMEAGCGIAPIRYRRKSMINALQWAIGLEWFLLMDDPWRVAMSTDHPNGGSFLAYPHIIRLLMDRTFRADVVKTLPDGLGERCVLPQLDREYTLEEICIITRAGPARILGLTHKGHLGAGADADITVYTPDANPQTMFELPRHVIKGGELMVENGELRDPPTGQTLFVRPDYDRGVDADIADWFDDFYTIRYGNYPVDEEYLDRPRCVPCRTGEGG